MLFYANMEMGNTTQKTNEVANFLFENAPVVITVFVIVCALAIAALIFLAILWKQYKKDELILRKYKIDPSNEDIEELKKFDTKL